MKKLYLAMNCLLMVCLVTIVCVVTFKLDEQNKQKNEIMLSTTKNQIVITEEKKTTKQDNQTTKHTTTDNNEKKNNKTTVKSTKRPSTTKKTTTIKSTTTKHNTTKSTHNTANKKESVTKTNSAFYLSDYERRVVECIVMGEAGGESYKGQILVAQCILNACKKDKIQPSRVRSQYGYSGWSNNPSQSVKKAVSAVFDDGYKATSEYVLYFYAPKYARGKWHETQKFVCEVGGHRFFAEW